MQKLIIVCGPIEDPSPVATARRIFKSEHLEGSLSYKATIDLITSSKYGFLQFDTDPYLLSLIQVILLICIAVSTHILYLYAYNFVILYYTIAHILYVYALTAV